MVSLIFVFACIVGVVSTFGWCRGDETRMLTAMEKGFLTGAFSNVVLNNRYGFGKVVLRCFDGRLGMLTHSILNNRSSSLVRRLHSGVFLPTRKQEATTHSPCSLSRLCISGDCVYHRGCRLAFSGVRARVCHQWRRHGVAGSLLALGSLSCR